MPWKHIAPPDILDEKGNVAHVPMPTVPNPKPGSHRSVKALDRAEIHARRLAAREARQNEMIATREERIMNRKKNANNPV